MFRNKVLIPLCSVKWFTKKFHLFSVWFKRNFIYLQYVSHWFIGKFRFLFVTLNHLKRNFTCLSFCWNETSFPFYFATICNKIQILICFVQWFEAEFHKVLVSSNTRNSEQKAVRFFLFIVFRKIICLSKMEILPALLYWACLSLFTVQKVMNLSLLSATEPVLAFLQAVAVLSLLPPTCNLMIQSFIYRFLSDWDK